MVFKGSVIDLLSYGRGHGRGHESLGTRLRHVHSVLGDGRVEGRLTSMSVVDCKERSLVSKVRNDAVGILEGEGEGKGRGREGEGRRGEGKGRGRGGGER